MELFLHHLMKIYLFLGADVAGESSNRACRSFVVTCWDALERSVKKATAPGDNRT